MDLIEIKLIWTENYFSTFKKLFKNKRLSSSYINHSNFDKLTLGQDEIGQIMKKLKLSKQRVIRCFELIMLAKLDPKDALVHQRFGQEIKKKLQQQLTKNILAPYFCIENFQPQSSMFIHHQLDSSFLNAQAYEEFNKRKSCCSGDGVLLCLKESDERFKADQEALSMQRRPSSGRAGRQLKEPPRLSNQRFNNPGQFNSLVM